MKAADEILVLERGRIVERGRHEELIALGGTYGEIYDLELRDQEEAFEEVRTATTAMERAPTPAGSSRSMTIW